MQEKGLRLRIDGQELTAHPQVTDDPAKAGPQDYVIVTLKAHSVAPVATAMQPLLGPETAVVTAMNGIPWWYFHAHRRPPCAITSSRPSIPTAALWRLIPPERCIGCVVYPAARWSSPAWSKHDYGNRFMLGEPDGSNVGAGDALVGSADRGRLQGAGAAAHPRRHLGQAVGQSQLQSRQRAHRRRRWPRSPPIPAPARSSAG